MDDFRSVRRELYVLRWGEAGADAYLAERARQQAADDAQRERDNLAAVLEMLADREATHTACAPDSEPVAPPAEAVAVTPKGVQKRVMVERHAARWPAIETDMKDAGKNGLAAAAKAGKRAWREAAALDWARERSRLLSAPEPGTLDAVMGGGFPSRRRTLAR